MRNGNEKENFVISLEVSGGLHAIHLNFHREEIVQHRNCDAKLVSTRLKFVFLPAGDVGLGIFGDFRASTVSQERETR